MSFIKGEIGLFPRLGQRILGFLLVFMSVMWISPCLAMDEQEIDRLFSLSLEELINVEVITASRRAQPLRESPVTIDVITEQQIRASGAVNIWDLMRFSVGMDIFDARAGDGNRGIISVRGFPREYVNNLQVLVDGRSVFSGYGGGVYWPQLPVQIQDIQRIEIVRGPNAALYGSNAGLGVIQIFTKKPTQRAASAGIQVGAPKARRGMAAMESITESEDAGWRLSYTRRDDDVFVTSSGQSGDDHMESNKANLRGFFTPAPGTLVEMFSGGSWDTNSVPRGNEGRFRNIFGMAKLAHELANGSSLQLVGAYTKARQELVPITSSLRWGHLHYHQWDAGLMHRFAWADDRLYTAWGVDYRKVKADSPVVFEGKPAQINQIWRGFVQQTYRASEQLSLVAGVATEDSDTGGNRLAYQGSALFSASEPHMFRLSYSFSPTLPNLYEKGVNHQPSSFGRIIGNPDLKPEKLQSFEVSYLGNFMQARLQLESSIYYMEIDDVSASQSSANPNAPPPFLVTFSNRNRATAKGVEAKLSYRFSRNKSIYANYTYETLTDKLDDIVVVDATPRHKFNLGGMTTLAGNYTLSVNGGFKSRYKTIPANRSSAFIHEASASFRLDVRLAYQANEALEFALAGQNLLSQRHIEFSDFDGLEVPRTIYGSMQFNF